MSTEQRDVIFSKEAADMTGMAESTLRYWATRTPEVGPPSFKLGRRRAYRRSQVLAWIAEQERLTGSRPPIVESPAAAS